jgi:hypothetical protein
MWQSKNVIQHSLLVRLTKIDKKLTKNKKNLLHQAYLLVLIDDVTTVKKCLLLKVIHVMQQIASLQDANLTPLQSNRQHNKLRM